MFRLNLRSRLTSYLPLLSLLAVTFVLFLTNYKAGTYLTGWDNLHPEFNLWMNIKRSIFAVWQQYQGLGLLGGMGHAADLPRQIFLALLSSLPQELIRYIWTFLMLFTGSIGAYFLTSHVLKDTHEAGENRPLAFLGGLFYLLNLSTIQAFYVPFEAFSAHFAVLPWLILTAIKYFREPSRKNVAILSLVIFLSVPQNYIPTLFITVLIALVLVLAPLFASLKSSVKKAAKILCLLFAINAFWLLPFLYFTLFNSSVNLNAKINQMATDKVFLQNKEFGNLFDVILLRGFYFNNIDPNLSGNFTYMFSPWREYLANSAVQAIGFILFGIMLLGIYNVIRKPTRLKISFLALFLFSFTMLATATPPFEWLDALFRRIPLFDQAFRFPFTKFSILASLAYSVLFTLGIRVLFELLNSRIRNLKLAIIAISCTLMAIFVLPAFSGNLFYEKEATKIPQEYFQVFDFFKSKDKNTRVANLPQPSFWGWTFHKWGYGGSGFLWYGIEQPILDRAFDVWSNYNEQYYWELSQALYSKNLVAIKNVFNKYQINWLLVDRNVINPQNTKILFYPEIEELLSQTPAIKKVQSYGNIDIYKVALFSSPKSFMFTTNQLPTVNGFKWTEVDSAYNDFGNYISSEDPDYFYPLRSLFSNRQKADKEFSVNSESSEIVFTAIIPNSFKNGLMNFPLESELEKTAYANIVLRETDGKKIVSAVFREPQIYIDNKKIWGEETSKELFTIAENASFPISVNINGTDAVKISKNQKNGTLVTFALSNVEENVLVATDTAGNSSSHILASPFSPSLEQAIAVTNIGNISKDSKLYVVIPKVNIGNVIFDPLEKTEVKNCDNFRNGQYSSSLVGFQSLLLASKNATACLSISGAQLPHDQGYLITAQAQNVKGIPMHFWILNEDEKSNPIDTFFEENKSPHTESFIIPSMEEFGNAYSFHFENESIGNEETKNVLGRVELFPIPYNFLKNLLVSKFTEIPTGTHGSSADLIVSHPNQSLYIVNGNLIGKTLVLSQSFDKGWKAYEIKVKSQKSKVKSEIAKALPFIFGKEIKEHVKVNGWQNGWISEQSTINNQQSIVIVYLPQYLQYFGFIILLGTFVYLLFFKPRKE